MSGVGDSHSVLTKLQMNINLVRTLIIISPSACTKLSMKGYLAFPIPSQSSRSLALKFDEPTTACATLSNQGGNHGDTERDDGIAAQAMEEERKKRREHERTLGERSEIEWVRAGGVLRDAFGRRDKVRTERIRQELRVLDMERHKMEKWEAYESRWRAMLSSTGPITFVDFPWPIGLPVSSRDIGMFTRGAVSEFLFESLAVRTNTTTRRERIRSSLLRWHPDKISLVLCRVVPDDLELVREGIHVIFSILKALQDVERIGTV